MKGALNFTNYYVSSPNNFLFCIRRLKKLCMQRYCQIFWLYWNFQFLFQFKYGDITLFNYFFFEEAIIPSESLFLFFKNVVLKIYGVHIPNLLPSFIILIGSLFIGICKETFFLHCVMLLSFSFLWVTYTSLAYIVSTYL